MVIQLPLKAQRIFPKRDTTKQYVVINRQDTTNLYFWKLKYNQTCVVKLINVNRFVYKGTTGEQTGTNLFTEVPAAFSGLKLPAFSTKSITPVIQDEFSNVHGIMAIPAPGPLRTIEPCNCADPDSIIKHYFSSINNALNDSLIKLSKFGKAFNTITANSDSLTAMKDDIANSWDAIGQKKINLLAKFRAAINDPTEISLSTGYKNLISKSDSTVSFIEEQAGRLSKMLNQIIEICNTYDTIGLVRSLKCLDPCKSKKDSILYYKNLDSLNKVRKCIKKITDKIESFNDDVKKAKQLVADMKTMEKEGKLQLIQKNYDLIAAENFNYTLDEFLADKDVHDITINVIAESPVGLNQPQSRVIKIKAITTGGIKIDFSTGAFINYGNNNFLGPDYYYKKIDSVNKQIIETERTKKAMFSIGALAHFYIRSNGYVKPALSLGVSTTASFETVNLHYGISALIGKPGKPSRFVISAGGTLREVSLLDKRYQLNTNYKDLPDTVPVSKNFPKGGGFFAVTYNLFNAASK